MQGFVSDRTRQWKYHIEPLNGFQDGGGRIFPFFKKKDNASMPSVLVPLVKIRGKIR